MSSDLSLYIHIPFCKNICLYCNFLTFAHKNAWIPQYVESVCNELAGRAKDYKNFRIETIYFGGGTPSLISPLLIKKIIQQIKAGFKLKRGVEISIECNPESVDADRLKIYKSAGITRFSLGAQSLNKKSLWRVGRPHDAAKIFAALEEFKKAQIKNFGVDFIMGMPGQTLTSFQKEVELILKYHPAHLSYYFLSYDTKKIDTFIKESPPEEEQIKMYHWVCARLAKAGFSHYELSNWARPGHECEHNKRYWNQQDYLGIGLGANSIVSGKMWENTRDFDGYLRNPMTTHEAMSFDPDLKRMEYIMLSMRTKKGLDLKKYATLGSTKDLLKNAARYIESGHIKNSRGRLIATKDKGFLISDTLTESLI